MIYSLGQRMLRPHGAFYIAPSAQVIGEVVLGENASIWFGAVVRGDCETISIGAGTNIQDGAVLHTDPGAPLVIGERCTVGHLVMLHGCTLGNHCLVGIGSVILNHARIGNNCIVGANSLVTEGKTFPDGSLIMGSPAKVVRALDEAQIAKLAQGADHYIENGRRFARELRPDPRYPR
ncbi:MAG: gamma carbonic anhydrase family protein [Gammaproteobacteria bacterium]|nr:gamma carbonic anhydrase family protein [Gammaproteobacteria bacterium]